MPPFQDETDALEDEEGAVEGEEEEEEGEDLFGDNIERYVRASYLWCYSTNSGILPPPTHTHNPNFCLQLTKADVAETSFNHLLLILLCMHIPKINLPVIGNIAPSLYNITHHLPPPSSPSSITFLCDAVEAHAGVYVCRSKVMLMTFHVPKCK